MESINSFNAGMNSDVSKQGHSKDSYVQALNFRGVTELGASTGSLVNIKGNECKISFPNLQSVYKLIVTKGSVLKNNSLTITINGITPSSSLSITDDTQGIDIYNFIVNNFTGCYQNLANVTKTFAVAYEDNYVVLYQQPVYKDCSPIASISTRIQISYAHTDGTKLLFKNSGVVPNSETQNGSSPYVKGVDYDKLIIIGSTFILEEIYLIVAPDSETAVPNDQFASNGSVWKLEIDDITKQHTLTLMYSSNLDLTKFYPVPPSAITGRYESNEIKRVYFSDFYNKIRVFNTGFKQLMALNPTLLSVVPKVELTQGILKSINSSGSLPAGSYQLAYRLSKLLGTATNYSELSNPVYLTVSNEGEVFPLYVGDLGTTSKSITWKLIDLDNNYDTVEAVVIYKNSATSSPTITSIGSLTITNSVEFTYSNPTLATNKVVTLEEFLITAGGFTHAKTCDTKDNILFWGNVKSPQKSLDAYDARAFRADDLGQIKLTNSGLPSVHSNVADAALTPQDYDTINTYYTLTGDYSSNACYLKPSDPTKLGGEGINISYEFGTYSILTDGNLSCSTSANYDLSTLPTSSAAFLRASGTTSTAIVTDVNTYPQNNNYTALKQPENSSLLKGFQHEEIYRFGIQFFDLEGAPYFVKWIGDIKMPSYGDKNDNPDSIAQQYSINDFRLSFIGSSIQIQYMQSLYVKFTVDVSSISDIISGYEIVRVKRENTNKTIWGSGMINPFTRSSPNESFNEAVLPASWDAKLGTYTGFAGTVPYTLPHPYYRPYPNQQSIETLNADDDTTSSMVSRFKMFDCWDIDAGMIPSYSPGDKIRVRSRLTSVNTFGNAGDSGYRLYFGDKAYKSGGGYVPPDGSRINSGYGGTPPTFNQVSGTNHDNGELEPFFVLKMIDDTVYCTYSNFLSSSLNRDYAVAHSEYMFPNTSVNSTIASSYLISNFGKDVNLSGTAPVTNKPSHGKHTLYFEVADGLGTNDSPYDCAANWDTDQTHKLLALYYKPNDNLYGGATYAARTTNEYISCGEFIRTVKNNILQNQNLTFKNFGGDVSTVVYDMMKTVKPGNEGGSHYYVFEYNSSGLPKLILPSLREAKFSTSIFFPCTSMYNAELRIGLHPNRNLNTDNMDAGYGFDTFDYNTYCNAENDTKVYFHKPLNFQTTNEWINRVYFSNPKYNNEPLDNWSQYPTNNYYDVEGNYGPINALVSLRENMYYIQERGTGLLLINPVSMITDNLNNPVKLGAGGQVIQKHYYKAIDIGTSHQWSVYRSPTAITFTDVRRKKIYLFNGEELVPVSDVKGQKNFIIKRLHNELLKNDNPVIGKGILTTYDYYHDEFLYTFLNDGSLTKEQYTPDLASNENLTLAYSEPLGVFTSMYSFTPNLYINSNKYLLSTKYTRNSLTNGKVYFHNYGQYGVFYNTLYPSKLKVIVNDNPLYTKVFTNLVWNSESIKDNLEWNDDLNLYPGSSTLPTYVDDVNNQSDTFNKVRIYNDFQNTDWTTLTLAPPSNNLTRKERNFNLQIPRNKFNYDTNLPSTYSLFDPSKLTRVKFGEKLRDKYVMIDLEYPNTINNRFVINNLKTIYLISDR